MTPVVALVCPACARGLRLRRRHRDGGQFIGCSGYPECLFTADLIPGLPSPESASVIREIDGAIRHLVTKWHPDRRREPLSTHEVVAELNALRDHLQAAAGLRRVAA